MIDVTVYGRLLQCCKCSALVDLIELPWPWIDGATYQCGLCLEPVAKPAYKISGDRTTVVEPPAPPKQRWSSYDPKTSPWPAGF